MAKKKPMACRQWPDPTECSRCGREVLVAADRDWDNEVDVCCTCLQAEVERLRADLLKYGGHLGACHHGMDKRECDCGWKQAAQAAGGT